MGAGTAGHGARGREATEMKVALKLTWGAVCAVGSLCLKPRPKSIPNSLKHKACSLHPEPRCLNPNP